ncbi:Cation/H+ exchanger [Globomyces pollinis-pini]|nr:Cation/H+ exchanger [Globomyces pollinis-pini]
MLNNTHWDSLIPHNALLNDIHEFYWILGLIIVFFTVFSIVFREHLFVSEALVATLVGVLVGPDLLNFFNPIDWFGDHVEVVFWEVSRLVVSFQCLLVGLNLPLKYRTSLVTDMLYMVGPVMLFMWILSSLGVKLVFGLSWTDSFTIGACITPTDPVLANAIVSGKFSEKHLTSAVRSLIVAESGINDGLGLFFLWIPFYLSRVTPLGDAIGWLTVKVLLYQVLLSVVAGLMIGYIICNILKFAFDRNWIDSSYLPLICIALMFGPVGLLSRFGVDDILGCFFVGYGISYDGWFLNKLGGPHVFEMVDAFINMIYFFLLGALLPWGQFYEIGFVKLICLSLFILAFRRLPIVMTLWKYVPSLKSRKDAFLTGWFGPIGAGACFYATFAYDLGTHDDLGPIVLFVVFSSIIIHGFSVVFFDYFLNEPGSLVEEVQQQEEEGDLEVGKTFTLVESGESADAFGKVDEDSATSITQKNSSENILKNL